VHPKIAVASAILTMKFSVISFTFSRETLVEIITNHPRPDSGYNKRQYLHPNVLWFPVKISEDY
jgi:hypothetical protein